MRDHDADEITRTTPGETPSPTRRRFIQAGVAAGAGTVAAVAVGAPASANPGDPVLLAGPNAAGGTETLLTGGSSASPALALRAPAGTPPLVLQPAADRDIPKELPTGSLAVTTEGDLVIGGRANTKAYVNTSRWANRTLAVPPRRILDTRSVRTSTTWDTYIAGGKGNVDTAGKLKAKTAIHLSISGLPDVSPGRALAAYVNITVAATVTGGYITAHSASVARPGTSSLNWWGPNQILSNLVEVQLGTYGTRGYSFTIYTISATAVIVDVSGLILANPATS